MIYDDNGEIKNDNPTPTPANESVLSELNTKYKNYAQVSSVVVERPIPKNTTTKKDNEE